MHQYDYVSEVMAQAKKDLQLAEDQQMLKHLHRSVIAQDIRGKHPIDAIYILALKYGWEFAQETHDGRYIVYAYEHIPGDCSEEFIFVLEPKDG